jgi:hypothetical protein
MPRLMPIDHDTPSPPTLPMTTCPSAHQHWPPDEANVVRSIRTIGDWTGAPLKISEAFPEGEQAAVILEAPNGHIVGAARLTSRSAAASAPQMEADAQ